jgi:hypothetical protein
MSLSKELTTGASAASADAEQPPPLALPLLLADGRSSQIYAYQERFKLGLMLSPA